MPALVRILIRLLSRIWFRSIEIQGVESVPADRPLVIVANHLNALIDPILIASALPVAPRFLAKSTLWKVPILRSLFDWARVIPVHRKQDVGEGANPDQNREMFVRAAQALEEGGCIALFPEGQSHSDPHLRPLRTGAARIALSGPSTTMILPVGLIFESKSKFRSRTAILVGEPIQTSELERDSTEAVRHLTDQIDQALHSVTFNFSDWQTFLFLDRASKLANPDSDSLAGRFNQIQTFHKRWIRYEMESPQLAADLRTDVEKYDRSLQILNVETLSLRDRYSWTSIARWGAQFLILLVLRAPLALAGTALHYVPYKIPGWVGERFEKEEDQPATYKLYVGLILFPLWWATLSFPIWYYAGWRWGVGTVLFLILSAWQALRWWERGYKLKEQARAFWIATFHPDLVRKLLARRDELRERLRAISES